jgi:hypothetical protein
MIFYCVYLGMLFAIFVQIVSKSMGVLTKISLYDLLVTYEA